MNIPRSAPQHTNYAVQWRVLFTWAIDRGGEVRRVLEPVRARGATDDAAVVESPQRRF